MTPPLEKEADLVGRNHLRGFKGNLARTMMLAVALAACARGSDGISDRYPESVQPSQGQTLGCFRFTETGSANSVNLHNDCDERLMATVRWAYPGGRTEDKRYRFTGASARTIRSPAAGAIIAEGPWSFAYGDDRKRHFLERHREQRGTRLFQYWNSSPDYVAFQVRVFEEGLPGINSVYHVAEPNETIRVWASPVGVPAWTTVLHAKADPR